MPGRVRLDRRAAIRCRRPRAKRAGRRALALAASLAADETLLVLLSGGASALMAVPADGITLDDKRATTERLLRAGADIHALNTVRKHLSAIKGGWLAARAPGAVPHARHLRCRRRRPERHRVGSDGRRCQHAFRTRSTSSRGSAARRVYPPAVVARLRSGARRDAAVPKRRSRTIRGSARASIDDHRQSRHDAMAARRPRPRRAAITSCALDDPVVGEAQDGRRRAPAGRAGARGRHRAGPLCIVSSGETTVHVTGGGKGGRNQEFALAAAAPARGARRAPPSSPASAPTASTARPTRPARSSIPRRSRARGRGGPVARALSRRQQRLRVFRRAGRSHPHRSDRHERRRPPGNSVSLNFRCFLAIRFSR